MKKLLKNKKGFTLVELLAVIVVLGVIMAIAAGAVTNAISTARTTSWDSNCKMLKKEGARISAEKQLGIPGAASAACTPTSSPNCYGKFGVDSADYDSFSVTCTGGTCSLSAKASTTGKYKSSSTCSGSWSEQ